MSLLGRKIAQVSGEARDTSFLFQHCSVLAQRFNAVCCAIVCLSLTARTDHHTRFCIFF